MKWLLAGVLSLCLGSIAQANVFDLGPGCTNLETVTVGDPGNAADTVVMRDRTTGYGSVSYTYNIGKYEVTAGQYCDFLNAVAAADTYGLYNTSMWSDSRGCKIHQSGSAGGYSYSVESDYANRPVNYVSYWDSCRFANWLGNGQKTGAQDAATTERGAYTLNGCTENGGRTIQRNAGWTWAVTSEDEWYKAAYFRGGNTSAGYWAYPTQSYSTPGRDMADASGNNVNYYDNGFLIGSPYYRTEVGEFQNSDSAYGTFDQGGNVSELNEALFYDEYATRGVRGGTFYGFDFALQSTYRFPCDPIFEYSYQGFRVAQAVPEPSSILALSTGLIPLLCLRRRSSRS